MKRVAVIGSGIAGLAAARTLHQAGVDVTLFEADARFGGHAHTVDVTLDGVTHGVDTGFLVYNERTYPHLIQWLADLQVATAPADMSFSVQAHNRGLEWSGSNLWTVFAQKRNLLRPAFWGMLRDIARFNRITTQAVHSGEPLPLQQSIGEFLRQHGFGSAFRDWYFLPMIACIWSCPTEQMMQFPVATLIRFCHNHGLLQVSQRPQWYSVVGGSRHYVQRVVQALPDARSACRVLQVQRQAFGIELTSALGTEHFDHMVLACHSDQALTLLGQQATVQERQVLAAVRYQANRAVLHTDASVLPQRPAAWAAWNYESTPDPSGDEPSQTQVSVHYLINKLQRLPWQQPVLVSLNPHRAPRPECVLQSFDYAHPVFDQAAILAQRRLAALQGGQRTWYCGAWTGYGFHEDGLKSGLAAAQGLLLQLQASAQGLA